MSDALKAQLSAQTQTAANKVEHLVSETGEALHRTGSQAANAVTKTFRGKISAVRGVLADAPLAIRDRYETVAESTDDFVRDRPWQAVGIGVGVGMSIGVGLGILVGYLARR